MKQAVAFAVAVSVFACGHAFAQKQDPNPDKKPPTFLGGPKSKKDKIPTSRFLHGTVVDEFGKPLNGALVTLTNGKSGEKTTFITKADGKYSFDELSFTVDYDLQARFQTSNSSSRKLSQYDRTADVVRILEVPEPSSAAGTQAAKSNR